LIPLNGMTFASSQAGFGAPCGGARGLLGDGGTGSLARSTGKEQEPKATRP
jgi:hypothetical protein